MRGQIGQIINLDSPDLDLKAIFPFLALPSRPGNCSSDEITIERKMDYDDIFHQAAISAANWNNINQLLGNKAEIPTESFWPETVAGIKNRSIQEGLISLVKLIEGRFNEATAEMNPGNIVQVIETPITLMYLYPGDTQIHYKLFAKYDWIEQ